MDFISWNNSQRSRMISSEIGARYFLFSPPYGFFVRQPLCFFWTIWLLIKTRPSRITIQYSFLLLFLVRVYQKISVEKIFIACDCHTKALRRLAPPPLTPLSLWLKRRLFRGVNHIFVHTAELLPEAMALNHSSSVLIDPMPDVSGFDKREDCAVLVFVCSFSQDEPINCIVETAKMLSESYHICITGNMPVNLKKSLSCIATISTGYLTEKEYYCTLAKSAVIIGLTTEDQCLQRSGYEALAFAKPYVTSDTTALRAMYGGAAVYARSDPQQLKKCILTALDNQDFYKGEMGALAKKLQAKFFEQINFLKR